MERIGLDSGIHQIIVFLLNPHLSTMNSSDFELLSNNSFHRCVLKPKCQLFQQEEEGNANYFSHCMVVPKCNYMVKLDQAVEKIHAQKYNGVGFGPHQETSPSILQMELIYLLHLLPINTHQRYFRWIC